MATIINPSTGFYSYDKALEVAKVLNDTDEDDWRYDVVDRKNGYGRVDVYDEDNFLIQKGFIL